MSTLRDVETKLEELIFDIDKGPHITRAQAQYCLGLKMALQIVLEAESEAPHG